MTATKLEKLQYQLHGLETELEQLESDRPELNQFMDSNLPVKQSVDNYQNTLDSWYEQTKDIRDAKVTLKQLIHLETILNQYGMGDM